MRALLCQQGLVKILDDEARSTLSKEEIAKLEEKTHNAILSSLSYRIMREIFRFLVCSFGVLNMRLCILWHWVVLPLSIGWNLNRSGVEVMKNSSLCMLSKTVIVKVNWKYLFILTSDKDKLCSMRKIKELQLCIS